MQPRKWVGSPPYDPRRSTVQSQTAPAGGVTLDEKTRSVPGGQSPSQGHRDPAFLRGSASEPEGAREEIPSEVGRKPKPTWRCEVCGKFYSERTAKAHGWCQQEQDRRDAESAWPA
jgi:hypothetical protein